MRRLFSLAVALAGGFGCNPDPSLPSLDARGERVRVGSDPVDQVCAGTLARLDREVEQIETRLDLPIQNSMLDVYVVDSVLLEAYCGFPHGGCARTSRGKPVVLVSQFSFERAISHELVHARLDTPSAPLFEEGLAEAASLPSCPRPVPDVELADLLATPRNIDFAAISGSYYVAEELVAWLLAEFGPVEVLSFMRSVGTRSSPSTIRAKYLEHFNRDLEVDALAHFRTQADLDALPPEAFGCFATPLDPSQGPVQLVADLDCDSEHVHNLFEIDGRGYVEWTLNLAHEQTLQLVGEVPLGTSLTVEECGCLPRYGQDEHRLARTVDARETLQPGTYRLQWVGELDVGLSLDVELVPAHED
jgi:hypothetical protein